MPGRRGFVIKGLAFLAGAMAWPVTLCARTGRVILPKGVRATGLRGRSPNLLDPRNLELTPISEFQTMGKTDNQVDPSRWRLRIEGLVDRPRKITYPGLKALPSFEQRVLLICPGFFSFYAQWTGISLYRLLLDAGLQPQSNYLEIKGPDKAATFPLAEAESKKIFLAWKANGEPLPVKHGFPLRLVVQDAYGDEWIKYVRAVKAVRRG